MTQGNLSEDVAGAKMLRKEQVWLGEGMRSNGKNSPKLQGRMHIAQKH